MNTSPISKERQARILRFLLLLSLLAFPLPSLAFPKGVPYAGFLEDETGEPYTGTFSIEVTVYDSAENGAVQWGPYVHAGVTASNGRFELIIDSPAVPLSEVLRDLDAAFFEFRLLPSAEEDWIPLIGRQRLGAVGFAHEASNARQLGGLPASDYVTLDYATDTYAESNTFATVARTGRYSDLNEAPDLSGYALTSDLAPVCFSGSFQDLIDAPTFAAFVTEDALARIAFTGQYGDLANRPDLSLFALSSELAVIATSGQYEDLIGKPNLGQYVVASSLASVARTGSYLDLVDFLPPEDLLFRDGRNVLTGDLDAGHNAIMNVALHPSDIPPQEPVQGQIWFDTTERLLRVYLVDVGWKSVDSSAALADLRREVEQLRTLAQAGWCEANCPEAQRPPSCRTNSFCDALTGLCEPGHLLDDGSTCGDSRGTCRQGTCACGASPGPCTPPQVCVEGSCQCPALGYVGSTCSQIAAWDSATEPQISTFSADHQTATISWTPLFGAALYRVTLYDGDNWARKLVLQTEATSFQWPTNKTLRIDAIGASGETLDFVNVGSYPSIPVHSWTTGTFIDNFDDGVIAHNYVNWKPDKVQESGGYLQVTQNRTDDPSAFYLPYDTGGRRYLKLTARVYQYRSNNNYTGGIAFRAYENGWKELFFGSTWGSYEGWLGGHLRVTKHRSSPPPGSDQFTIRLLDSADRFGSWFDYEVLINTQTGIVSGRLGNDTFPAEFPANTSFTPNGKVLIYVAPHGWGTGHYIRIDELRVESFD